MNDFEEVKKEKTYIVVIGYVDKRGFSKTDELPFRAYSKKQALHKWHEYIDKHTGSEWDDDDFEFLSIQEKK